MEESVALARQDQENFQQSVKNIKKLLKDGTIEIKNKQKVKTKPSVIPEVAKPQLVNERGLIYIGHLPHGFYEKQIREYFSQFGKVLNVRVARSATTFKSKGYAFVEFKDIEVAKIAANTMNNYLMFGKRLETSYVPLENQHQNNIFAGRDWTKTQYPGATRQKQEIQLKNRILKPRGESKILIRKVSRISKWTEKLAAMGIDYQFTPHDVPDDIELLTNETVLNDVSVTTAHAGKLKNDIKFGSTEEISLEGVSKKDYIRSESVNEPGPIMKLNKKKSTKSVCFVVPPPKEQSILISRFPIDPHKTIDKTVKNTKKSKTKTKKKAKKNKLANGKSDDLEESAGREIEMLLQRSKIRNLVRVGINAEDIPILEKFEQGTEDMMKSPAMANDSTGEIADETVLTDVSVATMDNSNRDLSLEEVSIGKFVKKSVPVKRHGKKRLANQVGSNGTPQAKKSTITQSIVKTNTAQAAMSNTNKSSNPKNEKKNTHTTKKNKLSKGDPGTEKDTQKLFQRNTNGGIKKKVKKDKHTSDKKLILGAEELMKSRSVLKMKTNDKKKGQNN